MSNYTKNQYKKDVAANEAALADVAAELQSYEEMIERGVEIATISDAWNAAHDRQYELEQERFDIERRLSQRNWTWQDHAFAELVSLNID